MGLMVSSQMRPKCHTSTCTLMWKGLIPTLLLWSLLLSHPECLLHFSTNPCLAVDRKLRNFWSLVPCTLVTVPNVAGTVCGPYKSIALFFRASGSQFCFHIYSFLWGHLLGKGHLVSALLPQEGEACILIGLWWPHFSPFIGLRRVLRPSLGQ